MSNQALRTNDPLEVYLKGLTQGRLLTPEAEIHLAKRIKKRQDELSSLVFGMPMTWTYLAGLRNRLKTGELHPSDIIFMRDEKAYKEQNTRDSHRANPEKAEPLYPQTLRRLEYISRLSEIALKMLEQQNPYRDHHSSIQSLDPKLPKIKKHLIKKSVLCICIPGSKMKCSIG